MKLHSKKGFTLIEMLVVIAIIAILVAVIVPTVTTATAKAKAATDAANLRAVAAEIAIDWLDNGKIDGTYTADFKSKSGTTTIEAYETNNEIQAFYKNGDALYGVKDLSDAAQDGKLDSTSTAPSGTGVTQIVSGGAAKT